MAEWESLAFCMRYNPEEVEAFKRDAKDLMECCKNLFNNWLRTNHGPEPKTYQTLLKHIKKIGKLATASKAIEKDLIKGRKVNRIITTLFTCYYSSAFGLVRISRFVIAREHYIYVLCTLGYSHACKIGYTLLYISFLLC